MAALDSGHAQAPLGSLLVEHGVITDEQLALALEEQKTSGEPLGAILVAQGVVVPATVAQALATQHGGLLQTEYGFAVGFGTSSSQPAAIGAPPISFVHTGGPAAIVAAEASPTDPENDNGAGRAELELASAETTRLAEDNERLTSARDELRQEVAQESQRVADLEREIADLRLALAAEPDVAARPAADTQIEHVLSQWQAAYGELEQRLGQATALVASLQETVAARDASLEELRASASALEAKQNELTRAHASEVHRVTALQAELAAAEQRLLSAEASESMCVKLQTRLEQIGNRAAALEAEIATGDEFHASASEQALHELEQRLQQAVGQLSAAESARHALEMRIAEAAANAAGLEARAADADELRRSALASEQAADELEHQLRVVLAELMQRTAELEELRDDLRTNPMLDAQTHLLFYQGADGYQLVERNGSPPTEGSQVELPDLPAQVVARIACSPLPSHAGPCAYLVSK